MKNRYKRKLIFVIAILSLSLVCCKSKTEPINNIASWTLDDGWTINGKDEIWYFGFSKNKVLFCAKLLDENAESEFETTMRPLKLNNDQSSDTHDTNYEEGYFDRKTCC